MYRYDVIPWPRLAYFPSFPRAFIFPSSTKRGLRGGERELQKKLTEKRWCTCRRLEVVGERENGRARGRHACLFLARPFFLVPTASKRMLRRLVQSCCLIYLTYSFFDVVVAVADAFVDSYPLMLTQMIRKGHTAVSRKVVGKNAHATIPQASMGCNHYTVFDNVAVEPTLLRFLKHSQTYHSWSLVPFF